MICKTDYTFCHFTVKNKLYIYEKRANLWQKRINLSA